MHSLAPAYQIVFDNLELEANVSQETHAQQIDWQYTADQCESSQPIQYENYLRSPKTFMEQYEPKQNKMLQMIDEFGDFSVIWYIRMQMILSVEQSVNLLFCCMHATIRSTSNLLQNILSFCHRTATRCDTETLFSV